MFIYIKLCACEYLSRKLSQITHKHFFENLYNMFKYQMSLHHHHHHPSTTHQLNEMPKPSQPLRTRAAWCYILYTLLYTYIQHHHSSHRRNTPYICGSTLSYYHTCEDTFNCKMNHPLETINFSLHVHTIFPITHIRP